MKPTGPFAAGKRRFPDTDYLFHSGFAQWRGYSSPYDGEGRSEFRTFYNLRREFRIEAARELVKEMVAFALILLTAAWPVIYMMIIVIRLLTKAQPEV
jgi:hypothetical protein